MNQPGTLPRRQGANLAPVEPRLLSEPDAARYLGIAPRTLRTRRALGEVRAVRIGRAARYDLRDLDAWIERSKQGAPS